MSATPRTPEETAARIRQHFPQAPVAALIVALERLLFMQPNGPVVVALTASLAGVLEKAPPYVRVAALEVLRTYADTEAAEAFLELCDHCDVTFDPGDADAVG